MPAEQPLVVISRSGARRWVSAVDRAARDVGLRVGMPASKAQAIIANLTMIDADPTADAAALERLALWILRQYSPVVAVDGTDVIDTQGADHLRGGETMMVSGLVNSLRGRGLTARAAVADTWGAAHALTRLTEAETTVVPVGGVSKAVVGLPIHCLRLPADTIRGLRVLGVETVGELSAMPRAPLTLRFGPEVARRLDQLFGRVAEPIEPLRTPELVVVSRDFQDPIGAAETIQKYVHRLARQLSAELEGRGLGVRRSDLVIHRVDNTRQCLRAGLAKPVRDPARLAKLLCDRIEKIDPGFGIEKMVLVAVMAEPLQEKQTTASLMEPATMRDRQVVEWDKDDIEALKFMKVDVLALGMLSCMARSFELLAEHKNEPMSLADVPQEDQKTYAMIRRADTLGTFQIESRAQMAMLPRLKPRTFYDLVVQVAIVRPGPIQGDMVHPYLRRREGKEKVEYPTPELEAVLGKTLGVPLFQESAMKVAMVCAGFSAGEADQLRRAMATFKFTGGVTKFKDKLVSGMVKNGYSAEFAERTFTQLEGFGSYGFPESHAASFALVAYASSWMKCHHPEIFCAALINSQPMGFYSVAQIVTDARQHGVEVRPVCVNASRWDCTLERIENADRFAVRLGLRVVRGLAVNDVVRIVLARAGEPFQSAHDVWRRSGVATASLVKLAKADAFLPSLGLERREALWDIKALRDEPLELWAAAAEREAKTVAEMQEPGVVLKSMTEGREVVEDYTNIGLTLRAHPMSFLRNDLGKKRIVTCAEAMGERDGRWLWTAGLVLVRQRPGSAKRVMFLTLEDETGVANAVVWPSLFEKQRRVLMTASMMGIHGRIQREGDVVHLVAQRLFDFSSDLSSLGAREGQFPLTRGRGDQVRHGGGPDPRDNAKPVVQARDIYIPDLHIDTLKVKSRNFH